MRIVVDVMGGDHGCRVILDGTRLALERFPEITSVTLVGDESLIRPSLADSGFEDPRVAVLHSDEVLTMADKPIDGVRRKKNCSIAKGIGLVKDQQADVFISPGNTGGVVTVATIRLGRLQGVERPGIATVIPAPENEFVLLDAGANIECRPIHLAQYAIMGNVFSREILGYKEPRVGVLSVGTEDIKGNDLTLSTFKLCQQLDLNFIGNVEGHDLFSNRVDVVVCDGFVGNVVLKTCESLAKGIFGWMKSEITANPVRKLGALLAKGAFSTIKKRMDPDQYGGAPLLGLNGNVFIAHGSASPRAIMNAIRLTAESVQHCVNQLIIEDIAVANEKLLSNGVSAPVKENECV